MIKTSNLHQTILALLLLLVTTCFSDLMCPTPVHAESEAASEASSEAPMIPRRGRRGYYRRWNNQQAMQQRKAMQMQRQSNKQSKAGRGRRQGMNQGPEIREYGAGRRGGRFHGTQSNLNNFGGPQGAGQLPPAQSGSLVQPAVSAPADNGAIPNIVR